MMNRRQLLKTVGAGIGFAISASSSSAVWAKVRNGEDGGLADEQMTALTAVSDMIIPRTDTPGAVDVGVPAFIGVLLKEQFSAERREECLAAIDMLIALPVMDTGDASQARLAALDQQAFADWDAPGGEAWRMIKYLVVTGYYTSEAGATEELQFEAVPGPYRSVPLAEVGRGWAT